ncbi:MULTISPECIES: hypothetical protein [Acinetobacter]|uniref:hypothetical protein n=1 Tax=Acinetobacter TaxID=469 RepID=UPI000CFF525E|nr:hypothetical protein [Acinetobacter sp. MYb10]QLD61417.1 hypothetical protein CQZ96_009110 [Acinetobacter sp. MYb10]
MARSRNIKPSFFINEDLVELPFETRLLFIGLWTLCDREGYVEDKPKKIRMSLFPADDVNVEKMLNELQSSGFLIRYEVGNRKCIYLPKFCKHQNPHHKEVINDVPRYFSKPSQDLDLPQSSLGCEPVGDASTISVNENQEYINDLNSLTYGDSNENLGQALDNPQSSRADILIPDSLNRIPDCGNLILETKDSRFDLSLNEVNTKLQMGGLKQISQDELNSLIVKLESNYSHNKRMVKNQVLGKAFEWIERQQRTPLQAPKPATQYQTAAQRTASEHDRWRQAEQQAFGESEIDITPKKQLLVSEVGHA